MNIMTLPIIVVVIPLALIAISSQLWGERGVLICVGIILAITGLVITALGCFLVYNYLFNS